MSLATGESGAGPSARAVEALKPAEFAISSSVGKLGKHQEAICAGNKAQIAFLERGDKGEPLTEDQKKVNAQAIVDDLAKAKIQNGEKAYTVDDVLEVDAVIQKLTGPKGPYSGILFRSASSESATGITSAIQITVLANELARIDLKGKTQDQIAKVMAQKILELNSKRNGTEAKASHVVVGLIDKKGVLSVENGTTSSSIVIIDSEGRKSEVATETQLKPGEKVIVGDKAKIDSLIPGDLKGENLTEIVDKTTENHAAAGAETKAVVSLKKVEVEEVGKVEYIDDTSRSVKVEDYIKSTEYQENVVWLQKVIEQIKSSTSIDPLITDLKQQTGEDELPYTKRVVEALRTHLSAAGENANSELTALAASAEDVSNGKKPNRDQELTSLNAVSVLLNKAPGRYDSSFVTPEVEVNPEDVKTAFEEAFKLYKEKMDAINLATLTTQDQKEEYARYQYTKQARTTAQENPNNDWHIRVDVRSKGQIPQHFIQEGIPVEGIITFLDAKIAEARAANNTDDITKFQTLRDVLFNNSKLYKDIPLADRAEKNGTGKKFTKIGELMEARTQLEALGRHDDDLYRASHNSNDEARRKEDWIQGKRDLVVRRELILPKKKAPGAVDLGEIYHKKGNEAEILKKLADPEQLTPAPEDDKGEPKPKDPKLPVAPP